MNIRDIYERFINECNQQISIDSRSIIRGAMFVGLKGDQVHGNSFASQALDNGASYAIVDDVQYDTSEQTILVKNTEQFLIDIAQYHRKQFNIPVIAITGSNGKTTTKELVAQVLATQNDVVATEGNLNNHIGVPLTLLTITNETDVAVVEMGANHLGEIHTLCTIARPQFGVITNIGRAHLGEFGGFGNVIQAKTELYRYLDEYGGHVFVNGDDELLMKYARGLKKSVYRLQGTGVGSVRSRHSIPFVSVLDDRGEVITSQLVGEYNVANIACALSIGAEFSITKANQKKAIASYTPQNNRSEMVRTDHDNIIIKDYYNANATSMKAALENIASLRITTDPIIILGDMLELGRYAHKEHQRVVDLVEAMETKEVYLVGEHFFATNGAFAQRFKTTEELIKHFEDKTFNKELILLKASNGINFEKLFNAVSW